MILRFKLLFQHVPTPDVQAHVRVDMQLIHLDARPTLADVFLPHLHFLRQ